MQVLEMLLLGAFSYWFAALSGIPTYVKNVLFKFGVKKRIETGNNVDVAFGGRVYYEPVKLYPFACEKCLGFWLGAINFWGNDFWIYAGCTSLLAIVIGLLINKLR